MKDSSQHQNLSSCVFITSLPLLLLLLQHVLCRNLELEGAAGAGGSRERRLGRDARDADESLMRDVLRERRVKDAMGAMGKERRGNVKEERFRAEETKGRRKEETATKLLGRRREGEDSLSPATCTRGWGSCGGEARRPQR